MYDYITYALNLETF